MERYGLHAPIQRFGVLFAPSPAGSKEPQGAPAPSPEVGGPGFGYAVHDLVTRTVLYRSTAVPRDLCIPTEVLLVIGNTVLLRVGCWVRNQYVLVQLQEQVEVQYTPRRARPYVCRKVP
eukprot:1835258-Prymnesium_polylepis.1